MVAMGSNPLPLPAFHCLGPEFAPIIDLSDRCRMLVRPSQGSQLSSRPAYSEGGGALVRPRPGVGVNGRASYRNERCVYFQYHHTCVRVPECQVPLAEYQDRNPVVASARNTEYSVHVPNMCVEKPAVPPSNCAFRGSSVPSPPSPQGSHTSWVPREP